MEDLELQSIKLEDIKELDNEIIYHLGEEDCKRLAKMEFSQFVKLLPNNIDVLDGALRELYFSKAECEQKLREKRKPGYFDCKKCNNTGFIPVVEVDGYRFSFMLEVCECNKVHKQIAYMEASGLSKTLLRNTLDNYIAKEIWQKKIKDLATKYIKEGFELKRWFVLTGSSGCGKTHICTAIVKELFNRTIPCVYMVWDSEVVMLNAEVFNATAYTNRMNRFKLAPVLYIDDFFKPVGASKEPSVSDIKRAKELLDYRLREDLPTIISSELSINEIIEIDTAVGGRIYQLARDYCVDIRGIDKNFRLKKRGGDK